MIFGIVFVIVFILGFGCGLAMPFLLMKYPFKRDADSNQASSDIKDLIDEWWNGKRGD